MINYEILDQIEKICSWMEDEESKVILKQRFLFSLSNDIRYIYDMLKLTGVSLESVKGKYESEIKKDYGDLYPTEDLLTWLLGRDRNKIIILGCGGKAYEIKMLLDTFDIPIYAYADNNKKGKFLDKTIYAVEDIPKDAKIIISSYIYRKEMYEQLTGLGYEKNNIFYPGENALFCAYGTSYFDNTIFTPDDEGYFIDAGCFHGETSIRFSDWAKSYKGILAFEPEESKINICEKNLSDHGVHDAVVMNAGLWSEDGELSFRIEGSEGSGSKINQEGCEKITVRALDSVVNENKVSFIKMDIEGAELEALKGAQKTIQRDMPRMAICLYHKPQDIWEIPQYIKQIAPEYHMAVRHYLTYTYDTVLYCWK